jgi:hypothetical protein
MLSLGMPKDLRTFSLEELTSKMREISGKWHKSIAQGNQAAGRTLEKLLDVNENNISLPDYGTIEIKTKLLSKEDDLENGLITLFSKEPKPRASIGKKLVNAIGYKHENAGVKYPETELALFQTIRTTDFTNRGLKIEVTEDKLNLIFDPNKVIRSDPDNSGAGSYKTLGDWVDNVEKRTNPHYKNIMPIYYEKKDLEKQFYKKLNNTFYCLCRSKKVEGTKFFRYLQGFILKDLLQEKLDIMHKKGFCVDIRARSGKNHGTAIRMMKENLFELFTSSATIFE